MKDEVAVCDGQIDNDHVELDAPWFDPEWLTNHLDTFPLAATVAVELGLKEEQ